MDEWIREDYFLMFDTKRTSIVPLRDLDKHLPLYIKKGEVITGKYAPRFFTLEVLQKHGIQDQYEIYESSKDQI